MNPAPVIEMMKSERALSMMRWGMPCHPQFGGAPVTNNLFQYDASRDADRPPSAMRERMVAVTEDGHAMMVVCSPPAPSHLGCILRYFPFAGFLIEITFNESHLPMRRKIIQSQSNSCGRNRFESGRDRRVTRLMKSLALALVSPSAATLQVKSSVSRRLDPATKSPARGRA